MVDTADQARAIVDAERYACSADHEKRRITAMIETPKTIDNIDELLAVEGLTCSSSAREICPRTWAICRPPVRPASAAGRHHAAGKIAGTLVTSDELSSWLEYGARLFYVHSDPFLRIGLAGIKKMLRQYFKAGLSTRHSRR